MPKMKKKILNICGCLVAVSEKSFTMAVFLIYGKKTAIVNT
jgi:hypothetical protein